MSAVVAWVLELHQEAAAVEEEDIPLAHLAVVWFAGCWEGSSG